MTRTKPDTNAMWATHKSENHDATFLTCQACWSGIKFDAAAEPVPAAQPAPLTDAEARGLAGAWDRMRDDKPQGTGYCPRCQSYCYGDCSVG